MRRKYKASLTIIVILIFLVSFVGVSSLFFNPSEAHTEPKNVTSIISNITDYGYTLDDRDSKYMSETFEHLKEVLDADTIDYEDYAQTLAKLFVIDFYTLNNKINKYDVGSLEYILSSKVDMFKNKAMDTIYNDLIDNTYKDRIQELPTIKSVEVQEVKESSIKINEETYSGYEVTMKYTYEKDLGYDKEGTITLVKNQNKLEIAKYEPTIKENN